ncbi:HpcH/HpaI aldolase/citrate lyase family protein [Phycicoccus ginsengisoli]
MSGAAALARSLLFVPGDRPDRFDRAAASGADLVVCDLEDAVTARAKDTAREEVTRWLRAAGPAAVRLNAVGTPWHAADCAALRDVAGLSAVMVPKAEDPDALGTLAASLGDIPVVALVETALGLHRAVDLAAVPGVVRLAFGSVDYALDTGCAQDDTALLHARSSLVVASRVAGVAQPVDGVTVALDDADAAGHDAAQARRLGFAGKLCVHPRQVPAVNAAFTPSAEEVDRARRVVAVAGEGAASRVGGEMVDVPVLERSRRILRQAELWASSGPGRS